MKNPLTDKHLGIITNDSNTDRFAEVRQRAKDEYIIRKTKKNKQEKVPKYKIDERVVVSEYSRNKSTVKYCLVQIVDFKITTYSSKYYGIILKSTIKDYERIGRLIDFRGDSNWNFNWYPANVPEESIKWL